MLIISTSKTALTGLQGNSCPFYECAIHKIVSLRTTINYTGIIYAMCRAGQKERAQHCSFFVMGQQLWAKINIDNIIKHHLGYYWDWTWQITTAPVPQKVQCCIFFSPFACICINYMCIIYAVCTAQSMCLYLLYSNQQHDRETILESDVISN